MDKFNVIIICCILSLIGFYGYQEFESGLKKTRLQKELRVLCYNPALADTMLCPPNEGYVKIDISNIYQNEANYTHRQFSFITSDYVNFDYKLYFNTLPAFFELDHYAQLAILTNINKCGNLHFRDEYHSRLKVKDVIDIDYAMRKDSIEFSKEFIDMFNACVREHVNDYTGLKIEMPIDRFNIDKLGFISLKLINSPSSFNSIFTDSNN